MNYLHPFIDDYLNYCNTHKKLNFKTIKAYRIDLYQFSDHICCDHILDLNSMLLENYITFLHKKYKPKTVKRKIASVKALFHYWEYRDLIETNPFNKLQIKFRTPIILPKTIPLHTLETFLSIAYAQRTQATSLYQHRNALRNIAIIELFFATGIRISELCSLRLQDLDLHNGTVRIYGKGDKERMVHIGNHDVLNILTEYKHHFLSEIQNCGYFFVKQTGHPISDQMIRRMIHKYAILSSSELHITPHMFRHTFATSLLDAGVDIRYIQEMLGHSSINVTEIYTHVTTSKQKEILSEKHPRKHFCF